jgi:hypothetical protein
MRHVRAAAAVVRVGTSGLDDGGDRRRHRPRAGAVQPRAVIEAITIVVDLLAARGPRSGAFSALVAAAGANPSGTLPLG